MRTQLLILAFLLATTGGAVANVTLPKIFSDNMVLQRDRVVNVWGWGNKGESVTIKFNGQTVKAKASATGEWQATLKAMSFGGPFVMTVTGKSNTITLNNILIGDVWICSGQSNMEWIIKNTNDAASEIAQGTNANIRLFTVTKALSYKPNKDLAGGSWQECNPETLGDFSAVAYFFARKVAKETGVPQGMINSSWGGTNIQTWISWDIMGKKDAYKNIDIKTYESNADEQEKNRQRYEQAMKSDKGMTEKWFDPAASVSGWKPIDLPKEWSSTEIGNTDGIVWFRKEFDAKSAGVASLSLGPIDDWDETFVNGVKVGSEQAYNKDRKYIIPAGVLKVGKNVVTVKVTDTGGGGGLFGKPEQLFVENDGGHTSLAGAWEYKSSVLTSDFNIKDTGPNSFPSQLYNSMIYPIIRYGVKGGIWYQGESNTYEAYRYRTLFPELIANWRTKWGYEFPFFWVQLANFMAADDQPVQSEWAELREAQSMTMSVPQTGQAVIIDIGEANDIHPRNKQDVGYRLALSALKVAYGKNIVYSGPVYQAMQIDKNRIVLKFSNIGSGLAIHDKYGYVKGFAIAGSDQKFVWAKAYVDGDKIIVSSDAVANPVAVRYAWGNNPDANVYNKEGLPASPFRTDTWKGISQE